MELLPQRRPLAAETKNVLMEGIRHGRWKQSLPGERRLCQQLQVSRWTLRTALAALERQGWVRVEHGRPCRILSRPARAAKAAGPWRVGCIVPEPLWRLTTFANHFLNGLRARLLQAGGQLDFYTGAVLYRQTGAGPLAELVERNPVSCWVLALSTPWMQRWFQASGTPAVVSGSLYEGVTLPSQDYHSRAVGRHAAGAFLARGHTRIAFVVGRLNRNVVSPGILEVERGAQELCAARRGSPEVQFYSVYHGAGPAEVCRALDRLFRLPELPTAILFAQSASLLTALTYFAQLRIKVPDDLSIAVLQDEAYYPQIVPPLTHYEWDPEMYAASLCRLVQQTKDGTIAADTAIRLTPVFVPGASLGPPRQHALKLPA